MELKKEIVINKPVDEVWKAVGTDFVDAYKWASGLFHSEGKGKSVFLGTNYVNRVCETSFGEVVEEITAFDPNQYHLEYKVNKGFPSFVESGNNNWNLLEEGNHTRVKMNLNIQTRGFLGVIMGPMMKIQMNKITSNVLDDLKQYVETGEVSERKKKEILSKKGK